MTRRPGTVVFDHEAVQALADVHHPKHGAVLAVLEATNQRRTRKERITVLVPTAVRVEAGWDHTKQGAAEGNRISRASTSLSTPTAPTGAWPCGGWSPRRRSSTSPSPTPPHRPGCSRPPS